MTTRWMRWAVPAASAGCYGLALVLPCSQGDHGPVAGWECLLAPLLGPFLFFFPPILIGWIANPLFAAGLLSLWARAPRAAAGCSCFALICAVSYSVLNCMISSSPPQTTGPAMFDLLFGGWLWLAAMAILTVWSCILAARLPGAPLWRGRWAGRGRGQRLRVVEVAISQDTFPCSGWVVTQAGEGAMSLTQVTWARDGNQLDGSNEQGVQVATARFASGRLCGTFSAASVRGDREELTFGEFEPV